MSAKTKRATQVLAEGDSLIRRPRRAVAAALPVAEKKPAKVQPVKTAAVKRVKAAEKVAPEAAKPKKPKQVRHYPKTSAAEQMEALKAADTGRDFDLEDVLSRIVEGESAADICKSYGRKTGVLLVWLDSTPEIKSAYARAKEFRAHVIVDNLRTLASTPMPKTPFGSTDSAAVAQLRLQVDTEKWLAAKLLPKSYGDRLEVDAKVEMTLEERLKALASTPVPAHAEMPKDV